MNKLLPFLFCILFFCNAGTAQTKFSYWSVGINPFSPGESMSSIGPTIAYRVSPKLELWAETSFIFYNLYASNSWKNLNGYRFIFQPRYYMGRRKAFFIAPEFRLKQYSYTTSFTFINSTTADTLQNYSHKASQLLIGGAFVTGKQVLLSRRHNLYLELTAGIGAKQRYIKRKNIPAGYKYYQQSGGFGLAPHYEWDNDGTPYFPVGLRLTWKL
jgi:Protein of unknown function (DUF3575)